MFAITGITGQVGGQIGRLLREANQPVRAVLRDPAKADPWAARGCEIALAAMEDADALTRAFRGAEAVFVLLPPVFDPSPGYAEARAVVDALYRALSAARPARVVALSTIGAQAPQQNLLTQLQMLEQSLADLPMPVAFLRPAWFMENAAWDVDAAARLGAIQSYLQPLDKPVPMVATADVASAAAALLRETWTGRRVVELGGPERIAPEALAATFGRVLGRDVHAQPVPRATWEALFRSQGMRHPLPRMQMLDGFNAGWIEFEGAPATVRKGTTPLEAVLRALTAASTPRS
jgi:uncharacterized protein YbjT (DUF2867 family)